LQFWQHPFRMECEYQINGMVQVTALS